MSTEEQRRPSRSIGRKLFLIAGLLATIFLTYKIVSFVQEASVAVNIGNGSGNTPQKRIVNKSSFTPPADGKLRLDQVEMMLHIIESSDSVVKLADEGARIARIVALLNEYTLSLGEYRWVRSTIANEIVVPNRKSAQANNPLGAYEQLLLKDFIKHRRFFTDSLDKQLL